VRFWVYKVVNVTVTEFLLVLNTLVSRFCVLLLVLNNLVSYLYVYLLVLNDLVSCFNVLLLVLNNLFLFVLYFSTQQAFSFIFLLCG